jgi:hypothetical protein
MAQFTEGATFSEFVLARRLEFARRLLTRSTVEQPLRHIDRLRRRLLRPVLFHPRVPPTL